MLTDKQAENAKVFSKVLAEPVEVSFYTVDKDKLLQLAQNDEERAKISTIEPIKAWMHCLTDIQQIKVTNVMGEAMRVIKADGGDEASAMSGAGLAYNLELLRFAIRVGKEKNSAPLFQRAAEIMTIPNKYYDELLTVYRENFYMSGEELGNSLRARITTSLTN